MSKNKSNQNYIAFNSYGGFNSKKDEYELYPSLMFVFQLVAECLGNQETVVDGANVKIQDRSEAEMAKATAILPELWNSKFTAAILLLLPSAGSNWKAIKENIEGMTSPMELVGDCHATATYYVLTQYIYESVY